MTWLPRKRGKGKRGKPRPKPELAPGFVPVHGVGMQTVPLFVLQCPYCGSDDHTCTGRRGVAELRYHSCAGCGRSFRSIEVRLWGADPETVRAFLAARVGQPPPPPADADEAS